MNIELVRLTNEYREQLFEMLEEWKKDIIVNHTDMSPWKIWANDFHKNIRRLSPAKPTYRRKLIKRPAIAGRPYN